MKSYLMITGVTGGLGKAFVLECARRKYDLFLTDIQQVTPSFCSALAEKYGIEILYQPCDLCSEESRNQLIDSLVKDRFSFWGLINVAGLDNEGAFLERNRQQLLRIIQVNLLGTVDITRAILPLHDPTLRFRLINVCSMAGFFPMPYKAIYAASKRFLLDLSRALREEIKSFGTVTALCPAGMPTTNECMRSIFSQGFWGLATTVDMPIVARQTMKAALKGKAVVIPGKLNQFIRLLSSFVPISTSVRYVARRWQKARGITADLSLGMENSNIQVN